MSVLGIAFGVAVLAALAAIAAIDARRMTISPAWLAGLLAAGAGWLIAGGGIERIGAGWWSHAAAAAVGFGLPMAAILGAEWMGRRWPIYPGDAALLGAMGALLGLRGLFQAMAVGAALALVHRACIQRKRGRRMTSGYLPAGPGLAAGAAAVFVALNAGFALADNHTPETGRDLGEPFRIVATELPPVKTPLPAALAEGEVALDIAVSIPFADLVARIGDAAEIAVAIEERPARIAGGGATLAEPPPMDAGEETRLGALLDDVAARAGYGWEWKDERIVFYRYRDTAWIAERPGSTPPAPEVAAPEPSGDPVSGLFAWLGRLFGGTGREETPEASPAADVAGTEAALAASSPEDGPARTAEETASLAGKPADAAEAGRKQDEEGKPEVGGEVPPEAETAQAPVPDPDPPVWRVVPEDQKTLRGVLEAWAAEAEWTVAWRAERDFSVGAPAIFEGGFLEAVDSLLSDPGVSRVLTARAHANRYLVVEGTRP